MTVEQTNHIEEKPDITHVEGRNEDVDAGQLQELGYKQEFQRSMGLVLQIIFPFIGMAILPNWLVGFGPSLASGGPSSLFWGWVVTAPFTLCICASMAEIYSAYPLNGVIFNWCFVLASEEWGAFMSWMGGYMYAAALLTSNMTVGWNISQLIIGTASVLRDEVIDNTGAYVGVYILMTLICSGCGYAGITFTKIMNNFVAFWLVAATFVFVIGVLCLAPARNNASWVFLEFTNETGYDNMAIVFFLGLLQAGWTTIGYEQGITISESTENAAKSGPRGLLICIAFGLAQGFLITFAALFTIQDLDALISADLPIAEYFMQVTRNPSVSAFFMVMMIVAQAGSFANTAVSFTRLLHSMARNNCLPYSNFFRKLDRDVPVRLAILQVVLMIILILPVFGTMAILSTTIISYNCAYGMPLLTRLMFVRGKMPKGPFDLGRWSLPLNVAGLIWVLFLAVVLCFPSSIPTDGENFNYACVMLGAVMLFALVTWHTSGKYKYKGPDTKEVGEGFVVDSDSNSSTEKR